MRDGFVARLRGEENNRARVEQEANPDRPVDEANQERILNERLLNVGNRLLQQGMEDGGIGDAIDMLEEAIAIRGDVIRAQQARLVNERNANIARERQLFERFLQDGQEVFANIQRNFQNEEQDMLDIRNFGEFYINNIFGRPVDRTRRAINRFNHLREVYDPNAQVPELIDSDVEDDPPENRRNFVNAVRFEQNGRVVQR